MSKVEIPSFEEIKKTPENYHLGMLPVELRLPKMPTANPDGSTVTFDPKQNHKLYLMGSNTFPIGRILEQQGSIYAIRAFSDGRKTIVAHTNSPYTHNGEHMILWSVRGDNFRFQPTFNELSGEQGSWLFSTLSDIANMFEEENGRKNFFFGINVNEAEYERQSVQSIRDGMHVHSVRFDQADIAHFTSLTSKKDHHQFSDSFAPLALEILENEIVPRILAKNGHQIEDIIRYKDYPYPYPVGTSLVLKDDWQTLKNGDFFQFIQQMHNIMEAEYQKLISCFTDGQRETFRARIGDGISSVDFFRRLVPLPPNEIRTRLENYLQERPNLAAKRVGKMLDYFAGNIMKASDIIDQYKEGVGDLGIPIVTAHTINTKFIMEGLSYNVLIFPDPTTNRVLLSIVPRVTSGGSPLDAFGVRKTQYAISREEYEQLLVSAEEKNLKIAHGLRKSDPDLCIFNSLKNP